MAKIFLDANFYIDLIEEWQEVNIDNLKAHELFISPLSLHILVYIYKYKISNRKLAEFNNQFSLVSLNNLICEKALLGPTADFEDNIQFHSCAAVDCDYFLTSDKELLKTKFFGKAQIVNSL